MLAHMVIHVTLPAGFSCPGKKTGADVVRRPFFCRDKKSPPEG
ncbi:Uncharacterised protein [Klebsiella pneumoniae]|nr:Uncharacterised protein [Klebsiella pneumoniae]